MTNLKSQQSSNETYCSITLSFLRAIFTCGYQETYVHACLKALILLILDGKKLDEEPRHAWQLPNHYVKCRKDNQICTKTYFTTRTPLLLFVVNTGWAREIWNDL